MEVIMPIPTFLERITALQGTAELLDQVADSLNCHPPGLGLELLAQVIRRESGAIHHSLEMQALSEKACPSSSDAAPSSGGVHA
jgi:hypothetical protein